VNPAINHIWMVSREMEGIAGVGGVKDATRQLLAAIARRGIQATLVMPLYSLVDRSRLTDTGIELSIATDHPARQRTTRVRVFRTEAVGATVYLIDAPCYADKQGIYTYTPAEAQRIGRPELAGHGYPDFFDMNIVLQKAALELLLVARILPDLIHCQDAHTAFIPALMRLVPLYADYFATVGSGITVHNAGPGYHQETYDLPFAAAITELPADVIRRGVHRTGVYPFLVGGLYADFINTVSENYAREVMDAPPDDEQTAGIGAAFRERGIHLSGVTNGIDPGEYDPTNPAAMGLAAAYDPLRGDMAGKAVCRRALIDEVNSGKSNGLQIVGRLDDAPGRPLITMISRLTAQKGVDRFIGAIRLLLGDGAGAAPLDPSVMFLVLGDGDPTYLRALTELAHDPRYHGRVAVAMGHGPGTALRIYAAGDFFVNPAAFEPCGLTDYMAQLMGNVPVVHLVGGLVKVQDGVTGYGYYPHTSEALAETLQRAVNTLREQPEVHRQIVRQAVETIHARYTWDRVLENGYMPLYACAARGQKQFACQAK
jgi:starch synthase